VNLGETNLMTIEKIWTTWTKIFVYMYSAKIHLSATFFWCKFYVFFFKNLLANYGQTVTKLYVSINILMKNRQVLTKSSNENMD
jgi:hypothetical protein